MRARVDWHTRAFTLIEVAITTAILALAVAVILPALSNQSRADLRKNANILAGTIRAAYDSASLSGETYRLRFDIAKSVIHIEGTTETLAMDEESQTLSIAEKIENSPTFNPAWLNSGSETKADAAVDLLKSNELTVGASENIFQPREPDLQLSDSVRILDIWTEGADTATGEGEIFLYFFPHGYTQEAIIHLEDTEKRVFALKVAPLTGKVSVIDHYVEAKK